MKKIILLLGFILLTGSASLLAQSPHFEVKKISVQASGKGGESLKLYFYATYHGNLKAGDSSFTGDINVYYKTGKDSVPHKGLGSPHSSIHVKDNDSALILDSVRINADYFRNGTNNLIVIWPTGAKQGTGVLVPTIDSVKSSYPVSIAGLTGISAGSALAASIAIYPNPAHNMLNISSTGTHSFITSLIIHDITGQAVMTQAYPGSTIDVSALSKGVYIMELSDADMQKAVYRIVVY